MNDRTILNGMGPNGMIIFWLVNGEKNRTRPGTLCIKDPGLGHNKDGESGFHSYVRWWKSSARFPVDAWVLSFIAIPLDSIHVPNTCANGHRLSLKCLHFCFRSSPCSVGSTMFNPKDIMSTQRHDFLRKMHAFILQHAVAFSPSKSMSAFGNTTGRLPAFGGDMPKPWWTSY